MQTSVRSLLAMMADAAGMADVAPVTAPLPDGAVARMALDPGRAKIQLGWEPWTSLEEGLKVTVDSFRTG